MKTDTPTVFVALCTWLLLCTTARAQGDVGAASISPLLPKKTGPSKSGPIYYGNPDLQSNPPKSGSPKSGSSKTGSSKPGSSKSGNPVTGGTPTAGPRCVNRFPSRPLCKFVDSLRGAGNVGTASKVEPGGTGGKAGAARTGGWMELVDGTSGKILRIGAYQIRQKFHRDLPPTKLYAFGTSRARASYPGPTILARKGVMTKIRWENHLTDAKHMLQVDYTINKDVPRPSRGGIPIVPFRHGGQVRSAYSGHPQAWFTQYGELGPAFSPRSSSRSSRSSRSSLSSPSSPSSSEAPQEHSYYSQTYKYLNQHSAALLWYRDRTQGMGRLNLLAGLAGLWIPKGDYSMALVIADRTFRANGSLYYPRRGVVPDVHPNWVNGFYGNTIVVNGLVWPYLKVRPALHRFRLLSAANARFFNLSFICADQADYPNFHPPLKGQRVKFAQIGGDAGYLVRPSYIRSLLLAPGERKDIVVDFSSLPSLCRDVIVTNSAPAPFPNGARPDRSTGLVMRIVVTRSKKIPSPKIPERIANTLPKIDLAQAAKERWKMLVTVEDPVSDAPLSGLIDNKGFKDVASEAPRVGTYELWHIVNLSPIAHPIHIPLALHRPISRRRFDTEAFLDGFCALDRALGWASYSRAGNRSNSKSGSSGNSGSSSSNSSSNNNRREEKEVEVGKAARKAVEASKASKAVDRTPRSCFIKKPKGIPGGERLGWQDTSVVWPRQVLTLWVAWGSADSLGGGGAEGGKGGGGGRKGGGSGKGWGGFGFDATRGPGYAWHSGIAEYMDNEAMRPIIVRAAR
ncbi:hypothetical protein CLOM_g4685 [Closterium sp. NIES-68]|nr:hypothetical protein CLOM_g4685 [Closterium sp. NIES-68]GJP57722.1 hypothetical protein CLOP_g17133 [Closterium sp. NIES-67]